jgi:hypothetical protein
MATRTYTRLSDEHLQAVAEVYRAALATDGKAQKAVQTHWGIAPRSAGYWIATARARGFLPPIHQAAHDQDEALRELLSHCREREVYKGRDNEIGADTAYGDVADRLAKILDGES